MMYAEGAMMRVAELAAERRRVQGELELLQSRLTMIERRLCAALDTLAESEIERRLCAALDTLAESDVAGAVAPADKELTC